MADNGSVDSTREVAERIAATYRQVIEAEVVVATSIQVAEAAKIIENAQRDLNIALMNELALMCGKLGIKTQDVLSAARSKWNFLDFTPGLVGGHCIGIDSYYLSYKAKKLGYLPELVLAGRRVNDRMAKFVAEKTVQQMLEANLAIKDTQVAVLGFAFKENCHDIRNTKVIEVVQALLNYGIQVGVYDPLVDAGEVMRSYGLALQDLSALQAAEVVICAVAHDAFCHDAAIWHEWFPKLKVMLDVKSIVPAEALMQKKIAVWQL